MTEFSHKRIMLRSAICSVTKKSGESSSPIFWPIGGFRQAAVRFLDYACGFGEILFLQSVFVVNELLQLVFHALECIVHRLNAAVQFLSHLEI